MIMRMWKAADFASPRPFSARAAAALVLCLLFMLLAGGASAQQWTWQLAPERYQEMTMFERNQYDKAVELFRQNVFKGAATEFEKFQTQFPDSKILPHILFMRAYSLHQNKTRGEAIKLYDEVMDYFGDKVDDATPALYFMGVAHIENGDIKQGLKCMQEIVDDPDYSKHPLAAGALKAVGDNCWRNKEREKAVTFWKRATAGDFWKTNPNDANAALNSAIGYYILNKDYAGYEAWRIPADKAEDIPTHYWVAEQAWNVAWNNFAGDWGGEYTFAKQKQKAEAMKAFWDWFKKQRQWYEKQDPKNGTWIFYDHAIYFLTHRYGEKEEQGKLIDEAVAYSKRLEDKADGNNKLAWICERLRDAGLYERLMLVADQIPDRALAEYKKYEGYARQRDFEKAIARLTDIEAMNNDKWKLTAQSQRAWCYTEMGKFDEAIKLYQLINQPPGTLWSIQDCYKRWGKLDETIRTLTEIENSFPDQAANAAWHKAAYLNEAGEREKAIAQARRIMKVYPKSDASSKAHQLLESLGIKTGGGVVDDGD